MIEAVVVDLGGVAARFQPERRLQALSSLSGLARDVIQERLFDSGLEHRTEMGEFSASEATALIDTVLEHRVPPHVLVDAWSLAFEPDVEILECLSSLNLRHALFTNNGPMLDACLAGPLRNLRGIFDEVICSWHVRSCKPEPAAFAKVAERLGCGPDRLLLLDDSEANVQGAVACGWEAEHITRADDLRQAIGRRPDLRG